MLAYEFFEILGIKIANLSHNEVLSYFQNKIINKEKVFCVTLNTDILRNAYLNEDFGNIVRKSDFVFADGMPLIWLSKIKKKPLKERVTGRQVVYDLCEMSNKFGYKVFMLGSAPGVADIAKEKLQETMPNVQIVGTYSPSKEELSDQAGNEKIVEMINSSQAEILFVALGSPKQELWIQNNIDKLCPYVYIPCGGSIDFIAGVQQKSPEWIGKIGFEWLFRLMTNPAKFFKRYIINDLPFLIKLIFLNKEYK